MQYVGIDEVGRGALAGPLVVCAVVEPSQEIVEKMLEACRIPKLRDSKKMTSNQRERAFLYLDHQSTWSLGRVEAAEIDTLGLTKAATLAVNRALQQLLQNGVCINYIRADAGLNHSLDSLPVAEQFIKGDEKYPEIAMSSIMAKVSRDRHMKELDGVFPGYGFMSNVGYGTKEHYEQLLKIGPTTQHRTLFLRKLQKSG
jgi:ribonuclease HII